MKPDLVAEFDSAAQALDALAAAAVEPRASIEERLIRDIADTRVHGLDPDWWHTRWIRGPLRAIRVIEGLRLKFMVELDEVRQQLRDVEAELSLLREAGRIADAEFASRKAVRLLCYEADVRARLDAPVANRITAARNGIGRILEVSLRYEGRELLRAARESAQPGADPKAAQEAFDRAEAYNRLVAEAHRVTGGVDVPVFLPDHVARLRSAAGLGSAATPTVKVPVITQEALAARAAAAAASKAAPAARVEAGARSARTATLPLPVPFAPAAAQRPRPATAAMAGSPAVAATASSRPGEAPKTKPTLPRLRGVIVDA